MDPGLTYVTVKIVKMGLKDAVGLIDPYLTVSCKGLSLDCHEIFSSLDYAYLIRLYLLTLCV